MDFDTWFQSLQPKIRPQSAHAVLALAAEGATIPFMARYRKEQTGNLDEVAIQSVIEGKESWDEILKRQAFILEEIERQGKLSPELKETIAGAFSLEILEDLYLPYKQKRKTKASRAKEAGLEPFADWIWNCGHGVEAAQPMQSLEVMAAQFRNEEKGIIDHEHAIQGAQDILIERLSEIQELRQLARRTVFNAGFLWTEKGVKAAAASKYEKYFGFQESISSLMQPQNSHRYLAIRRAWMEEELKLSIRGAPLDTTYDERMRTAFELAACTVTDSPGAAILLKAARLALSAHVMPSIENEVHTELRRIADDAAIRVFAENVRKLLLASPFGPKAVMGIDPGIRTGCKVAIVDDSGKFVANQVLNLQTPHGQEQAKKLLFEMLKPDNIRAIAIGNGTAGRESELFVRAALEERGLCVPVVMVNEAGASVYSASEAAREEFPDLDVTVRGAISIARRLQDPLAELVKIDPKSIGVGQYQHDVAPAALKKSLTLVVDSCVNSVGVNLNTASYHLLSHVSGIGSALAKAIVGYRSSRGLFQSRRQLLEVPRFSKKTYEQAAGFLRIPHGEHPLDNTGVHPERYALLDDWAKIMQRDVKDFLGNGVTLIRNAADLAQQMGQYTFNDVIKELEKPGRDPRAEFTAFHYRADIHELPDLTPGMICPGIVTNVTNFGAFVDIGVHQDGLVHISQLSDRFVKDPQEVVSPGDRVQVRVLEVNLEKKQIALSMKTERTAPRTTSRPALRPKGQETPPPAKPNRNTPFAGLSDLLKSTSKDPPLK
ncbi:MAG: RNA-binding transcriptional accessory protein [Acidobacteria bacterium]|nr:RNA-binding transcriptional accessory protein [Acidobacteriota bacterium]MBI3655992.1 RNA-binding transcriptional accessory protein [Acidobacteriota bacterium]